MIPPDFIQQLLARVDIVDVVDKHVKLKKAGQNYSACCPFHNEKTPSFSVSPQKQFYHCFGCGAHGTAISFLMEYAGMGFRDVVKELAEGVGLTMPQEADSGESIERAQAAASLGEVMTAAMDFYRAELKRAPKAIEYFKSRGVSGEIAAKFGLGYSPDDWQGLKAAVADYSVQALAECGLVIDNEEGRRYDRFRDRVMFPILDQRGNVIGFGGRVIGAGEPKYLNSPETPLFEKGRELYGLFQARRSIRDTQTAIVVEGYMDVVALAQNGVENAVATLGTATTPTHVQKLLRMADNLVFCFDGDKAGRKAAWRALEQSLPVVIDGKDVRFLFLPAEDDPDTFVRRLGKDAFMAELKNAKPLSTVLFEQLSSEVDPSNEEGRARLLTNAKPLITQVSMQTAPALAMMLRRRLAETVGLAAAEIERIMPINSVDAAVGNGGDFYGSGRKEKGEWQKNGWQKPPVETYRDGSPKPRAPMNADGTKREPWGSKQKREPVMPVSRKKAGTTSLAVQLIARMLLKPVLAGRFDIATSDEDTSEIGSAYRVAAFIRDHDFEVSQAGVIEHFRNSNDEGAIDRAASHPLLLDVGMANLDLDAEFDGALERLREDAAAAVRRAETEALARERGLA
jgi:DNA primase